MSPPVSSTRSAPLYRRAALVSLLLLSAVCAAMVVLVRHSAAQNAREANQRLNLGLAAYVVAHQGAELIDRDGRPDRARMDELAQHVMMINPAVEVYLLDARGHVLAHALHGDAAAAALGRAVDLAGVTRLAAGGPALRLPLDGDDPLRPGRRAIASAAPLDGAPAPRGYLYIVLDGEAWRGVAADMANSETLRELVLGVLLVGALAAAAMLLAWRQLTQPLRALAAEVHAFRNAEGGTGAGAPGDEIGLLRHALHALQARVAEQFRRLEDGDRQRRELVSSISHDLRTPLASIRGYVETALLRADAIDAATRAQHLRTALRHADQLGRRIADLFELSKLDAGRVAPKHERFCLAELLQDVVQNYQLAARERGVTLGLDEACRSQAIVSADIAMIERVLQNLVDNALRFTPAGGRVTLALAEADTHFTVSVADTGAGIAAEDLPFIFERYWRAGSDAEMQSGASSGLGLAIVKRIVELHGSVVRVSSERQRGTRFEFALAQA